MSVPAYFQSRVYMNSFDVVVLSFLFTATYFVICQPGVEFGAFFAPFLLTAFVASGWGYFVSTVVPPKHGPSMRWAWVGSKRCASEEGGQGGITSRIPHSDICPTPGQRKPPRAEVVCGMDGRSGLLVGRLRRFSSKLAPEGLSW